MRVAATAVGDYDRIRVEPVTGSIGAEIGGVDLRELDDELIAELDDAWMAHKVLFFRDQDLTQAQHIAYILKDCLEGNRPVVEASAEAEQKAAEAAGSSPIDISWACERALKLTVSCESG